MDSYYFKISATSAAVSTSCQRHLQAEMCEEYSRTYVCPPPSLRARKGEKEHRAESQGLEFRLPGVAALAQRPSDCRKLLPLTRVRPLCRGTSPDDCCSSALQITQEFEQGCFTCLRLVTVVLHDPKRYQSVVRGCRSIILPQRASTCPCPRPCPSTCPCPTQRNS